MGSRNDPQRAVHLPSSFCSNTSGSATEVLGLPVVPLTISSRPKPPLPPQWVRPRRVKREATMRFQWVTDHPSPSSPTVANPFHHGIQRSDRVQREIKKTPLSFRPQWADPTPMGRSDSSNPNGSEPFRKRNNTQSFFAMRATEHPSHVWNPAGGKTEGPPAACAPMNMILETISALLENRLVGSFVCPHN